MERGCLWNSFVMIGHVNAFLDLVRHALPDLVESFESIRQSFFTTAEQAAVRDLYSAIPAASFSEDALSVRPGHLAVLPATGLGWSDLGNPSRVLSVIENTGVQTEWKFRSSYREIWRPATAAAASEVSTESSYENERTTI
jgi:mannose-1-phosphate guanylyltransferase